MDIQIGDRFTDSEGEWEVVSHPATRYGAKSVRARVRRTGPPDGRARGEVAGACESGDSEDSVSLLSELNAFFTEHLRCGDLDAGVDGADGLDEMRMRCEDSAALD
jgi:hypothetical protein